jgi:hypothetical protein
VEEPEVMVEPPIPAMTQLDMGFEVVEGFSRPNWTIIQEFIKGHVSKEDLSPAWRFVAVRWLQELAADLGGGARLRESEHFYCLSDLPVGSIGTLLDFAESARQTIRECLKTAVWGRFHGKHVLLVFSDPDDYYAYISYFYGAGVHPQSGGVLIHKGYVHIALPAPTLAFTHSALAHELVHNHLCHLAIPLWLNEGLAVVIEGRITHRGVTVDGELVDRLRAHWNETNIQGFWAGTAFGIPGDESELSYSLAEILVCQLAAGECALDEFIKAADWRDGGQDAAARILGHGLEELASGLLGPGNWRPQRKVIKEQWQRPAPSATPPRP